jgi:hypothetical protein
VNFAQPIKETANGMKENSKAVLGYDKYRQPQSGLVHGKGSRLYDLGSLAKYLF